MVPPSRLPPPPDSAPRATVAYRAWAEVDAWWRELPHDALRALEHARAGAHLLRALALEGQAAALPAAVSVLAEAAGQARAEQAMRLLGGANRAVREVRRCARVSCHCACHRPQRLPRAGCCRRYRPPRCRLGTARGGGAGASTAGRRLPSAGGSGAGATSVKARLI